MRQSMSNRPGPDKLAEFQMFVHESSPNANPTNVMLFEEILKVSTKIEQITEKRLGLGLPKFRLLFYLMLSEKVRHDQRVHPSELSEMQGISRNAVSGLLSSLESEGLVHRDLSDTDRRKFVISLTNKGRKLVSSNLNSHFYHINRIFAEITPEAQQKFIEILSHLNSSLERL